MFGKSRTPVSKYRVCSRDVDKTTSSLRGLVIMTRELALIKLGARLLDPAIPLICQYLDFGRTICRLFILFIRRQSRPRARLYRSIRIKHFSYAIFLRPFDLSLKNGAIFDVVYGMHRYREPLRQSLKAILEKRRDRSIFADISVQTSGYCAFRFSVEPLVNRSIC